jgi:23S rRNA (uridine2552-2'-O)-methyltransferase
MARFVLKDSYYKKAKKDGFRARSAFKLEEIQQKFSLIKKGDVVLDLGAAPGSWLQLESNLSGPTGKVVGIDILPIQPLSASNISLKKQDIREMDVSALLAEIGASAFDVITSDIAPNLSGIKEVDTANIRNIYEVVIRIVNEGLKKGGAFLIKLFMSSELDGMISHVKPVFSKVTTFKPKASRDVSSEVYVVCTGKH